MYFSATFPEIMLFQLTLKPLCFKAFRSFRRCNFLATFPLYFGVLFTQSTAAFTYLFRVVSCIDIHGRLEIGMS